MDADTLMINPAVAIHHTLPPDTLDPEPLVLGEVDFNGFCNGIIFWKASLSTGRTAFPRDGFTD